MKEKNLRLRLVVRRHGLPEVRVLFNVPLDNDPTIAKLVELVNETIPLEGTDWGLEDYAVELRDSDGHAFECLHFQHVATVLEKDEEVFIRPLLSDDLKKRRLSGRYQITSDGRHLIDGIPYGRPLLKRPIHRPAIHISPRKKRRITQDDEQLLFAPDYDDDDDNADDDSEPLLLTQFGEVDGEQDPASVRLRARFVDADIQGDVDEREADEDVDVDEEEDDADFTASDVDDEEGEDDGDIGLDNDDPTIGQDELKALRDEIASIYDVDKDLLDVGLEPARPNTQEELDLSILDQITALRAAFPTATARECETTLLRCNKDERKAYKKLATTHGAHLNLERMLQFGKSLDAPAGAVDAHEDDHESEGSEADSVIRHFDEHGFPPGSIQAGTALSYMARARHGCRQSLPQLTKLDVAEEVAEAPTKAGNDKIAAEHIDDGDTTSSSDTSSDSDSDSDSEDSSDDESDSDGKDENQDEDESEDESDSRPEEAPTKPSQLDSDSETSSSDSDSVDSDDASDSGEKNKQKALGEGYKGKGENNISSESDGISSESDSDSESSSDASFEAENALNIASAVVSSIPREKPRSQDQARFPKPEVLAAAAKVPQQSSVPPGQGMSRTQKRNARRKAKKLNLRAADQGAKDTSEQAGDVEMDDLAAIKDRLIQQTSLIPEVSRLEDKRDEDGPSASSDNPSIENSENSLSGAVSRRARLDLGAGRRMLFSALGMRNPKTKADEDKIRSQLMKDVRPHVNRRVEEAQGGLVELAGSGDITKPPTEDNDPEAWREKIIYRAVECCHEDVHLSEPPFPFVQRWDPQQQGRNGKRKDRGDLQYQAAQDSQNSRKKRRVNQTMNGLFEEDSRLFSDEPGGVDVKLNYDDIDATPKKVDAAGESQFTDVEDLPSLPEDMSSLPSLRASDVKSGMVITWRHWLLSKATNWQPQVSNLTAVVTGVHEDGSRLEVLLARRDRNLDRNEKVYDDEGKRIYDRFEAPDLDEEDGEQGEEQGYRTLAFAELEDPRVVQLPLATPAVASSAANLAAQSPPVPWAARIDSNKVPDLTLIDSPSSHRDSASPGPGDGERSQGSANAATVSGDAAGGESIIPETNLDQETAAIHGSAEFWEQDAASAHALRSGCDTGIVESRVNGSPSPPNGSPSPGINSPSRQLEEDMSEACIASAEPSRQSSRQPERSPRQGSILTAHHSQPIVSQERDILSGDNGSNIEYPKLDLPVSSTTSVRSGRQPDPDFSIDLGNDSFTGFDDTMDDPAQEGETPTQKTPADITAAESQITPIKLPKPLSPTYTGSSTSSIPSLQDIFFTASTSRKTQSPLKSEVWSALKARKSKTQHDQEYEAAMRKLDDDDDDDKEDEKEAKVNAREEAQIKASPTQDSPGVPEELPQGDATSPVRTFDASVSPPAWPKGRTRAARKQPARAPFSIPEGSQVVSLVSSSPEPEYTEDYAEDSADETYDEPKALPRRSGWVQKRTGTTKSQRRSTKGASTRGVSAATAMAARRAASLGLKRKTSVRS
ncbi:hypothetical protein NKR23_g5521 [Pleurostoma richardsiae]|uniref:DUF7357 domain-containing protein n=1 Tax=Pleurostoma richardsiae TaxID=41990 RepID=A0AA38RS96_9PEZI|nr:hypothetical protein NKR23_g5521 [Pleurostoma richardsiae]